MTALLLNLNISYETTECITCGVTIALPTDLYNQRLGNGKNFYCPNGHSQHFTQGQTREDMLRKQLEAANRGKDLAQRQADIARDAERYQRRCVAAQKAAKTRLRNRIKNGVCPCCNRTFKQLAAHMKTQHPKYMGHKK